LSGVVTEKVMVTNYFWCMDPSVQFLLGSDIPTPDGATIHALTPPTPVSIDDDKIGFTLDVASRLDREADDVTASAQIVQITEGSPEELADSA
jgi:hypothetical protein